MTCWLVKGLGSVLATWFSAGGSFISLSFDGEPVVEIILEGEILGVRVLGRESSTGALGAYDFRDRFSSPDFEVEESLATRSSVKRVIDGRPLRKGLFVGKIVTEII